MSIRFRILTGCLALTVLTGLLGLYALTAERALGGLALHIYDDAFMSVSYLRAAQIGFAGLAGTTTSSDSPADVLDDLEVARDRSMSPAGHDQVVALTKHLQAVLPDLGTGRSRAEVAAVQAEFEHVVETFAADGFSYRKRVAATVVTEQRRATLMISGATLAALVITAVVTNLIAPPVRRAVRVAQSIADGRLDNEIDQSGRGETGDLLRALSAMQASIAAALARVRALMAAQAENHADEIAAQHARMEAALDNMNQGLCLFDATGHLAVANRRFAEMFGIPDPGASCRRVLEVAGLGNLADASEAGWSELSSELSDGRVIAVSQQVVAGGGWVATYEDISERRAAEARLAHMARHDSLTGLPNRLLFGERTQEALSRVHHGGIVALLCLDLDGFKAVNDTLGHPAGDELLCQVASRLLENTREIDLVARLGGDEFAIVQENTDQPMRSTNLARRMINVLATPFDVEGQEVIIGVSVGIAFTNEAATSPDTLLKCADMALYRAKAHGRGTWCFFEAEMDARLQRRRALELDLRHALAENQFELFYQPLMERLDGIAGFEALVRWRHPVRGMVSPGEFIPLAEETGMITALGSWVLRRACTDAASWSAPVKVAVNLSPAQFRGEKLENEVIAALEASGLQAGRLELEITESVLLRDDDRVLTTLHRLRALGVRIAMDDFGTGFSSLGYLGRFPFDKIKIDQSFIRGMMDRPDCRAIVRAAIGLGRSLGMSVTAEGVETMEQAEALRDEGCTELQGYLFSRPQPHSAVPGLIRLHGCAIPSPREVAVLEA